jgi:UDP-N-acetylglucosamine 2-epimerase (non-hydrolysing)
VADQRVVVSVVGTRPNFMKMAPIVRALAREPAAFRHVLIHTGQHYDEAMSRIFLEELAVGEPDFMLDVGSGTHAAQTARVMERIEPVLTSLRPDLVLVPGDVNSTLAAALVAAKLGLPVGHVEAGLRSFDRDMPEEINRILTDQVSDLLFIHSPEAREHLKREGIPRERIHYIGNTMIDTLVAMRRAIAALDVARAHGVEPGTFAVVTLHRPALVDGPLLAEAMAQLDRLGDDMPVIFPIHPRTRRRLAAEEIEAPNVQLVDPLGYVEFLSLVSSARAVLTDSGGIQEETTFLGIPCFTLRDNTERPITCTMGTNQLLGLEPARIAEIPGRLASDPAERRIPPLWDGNAATRLVDVLRERDSFATLARAA